MAKRTKKSPARKAKKPTKATQFDTQEMFQVDKIWYGVGIALVALAIVTNVTYTKRFSPSVLGKSKTNATDKIVPVDVTDQHAEMSLKEKTPRYRIESADGETKLTVEDENGEEVREWEHVRVREELEKYLAEEKIEISSDGGHMEMEHNAVRARVNFPLSIDPVSRELVVSTPNGEKVVTILPDAAVANVLTKGFLSTVSMPETTDTEALTDGVVLTLEGDNLVYELEGEKEHKLFGFIPVTTQKKVTVSALTGETLSQTQTWLSGLVDLFSL